MHLKGDSCPLPGCFKTGIELSGMDWFSRPGGTGQPLTFVSNNLFDFLHDFRPVMNNGVLLCSFG